MKGRVGRALDGRIKGTVCFRKRGWKRRTKVAKMSNKIIFKMQPQATGNLTAAVRLEGQRLKPDYCNLKELEERRLSHVS